MAATNTAPAKAVCTCSTRSTASCSSTCWANKASPMNEQLQGRRGGFAAVFVFFLFKASALCRVLSRFSIGSSNGQTRTIFDSSLLLLWYFSDNLSNNYRRTIEQLKEKYIDWWLVRPCLMYVVPMVLAKLGAAIRQQVADGTELFLIFAPINHLMY